jgi:hypothetical protein
MTSTSTMKRWQDRFFCLSGHYLKYFSIDSQGGRGVELKGTIDLNHLTTIQRDFEVIKLGKASGEMTHLKAKTQEEAAEWHQILKDAAPAPHTHTLSTAELAPVVAKKQTQSNRVNKAMGSVMRAALKSRVSDTDNMHGLALVEAELARKTVTKQRVRTNILAFKAGSPEGSFMDFLSYFEPAGYQNYKRGAGANEEDMGPSVMGPAYPHFYKEVWDAEDSKAMDAASQSATCDAAAASSPAGESESKSAGSSQSSQEVQQVSQSLLGPMIKVSLKQCQMDIRRERVVVDGAAYLGKDFLDTLRSLLCDHYGEECATAIEPVLLQLCSRTSWGGDLYLGIRAQLGGRLFSNQNSLVPAREEPPPLQVALTADSVQCTMQVSSIPDTRYKPPPCRQYTVLFLTQLNIHVLPSSSPPAGFFRLISADFEPRC